MASRKPILPLLLLVLCTVMGVAQVAENYRFTNFGVKDGLTDKNVYSCAQDKAGYMWFVTSTGLFRYDGHGFTNFRSPINRDGQSIANVLQSIFCDRGGNLWLGSFTDLQCYNPQKNLFWRPRENDTVAQLISKAYILSFSEDRAGNIWIATEKEGFFCFRAKDSVFINYRKAIPPGIKPRSIKVLQGTGSNYFAIMENGLVEFEQPTVPGIYHPANGAFFNGAVAENDNLFMANSVPGLGVLRFNMNEKRYYPDFPGNESTFKNTFVHNLAKDRNGWWVLGYDLYYVSNDGRVSIVPGKQPEEFKMQAWKLTTPYLDRQQNLWVCSYNGISMLSPQNQHVRLVPLLDPINKSTLEPIRIAAIKGTGDFAIGTTNSSGLVYYQDATRSVKYIPHPYGTKQAISGVIVLPNGQLLLSDQTNLFLFDPAEQQLIRSVSITDMQGKPLPGIFRGCFDPNGNVYLASVNNSFYLWPAGSNTARHVQLKDIDSSAAQKNDPTLYPCFTDSKGNTWFTSSFGVYEYRVQENRYRHYLATRLAGVPMAGETNYITEDKFGHYWVCTLNNGLYEIYFENGKEQVRNYNKNSGVGIPSDYVSKALSSAADSMLWVQTGAGLVRFDPRSKRVLSIMDKQRGFFEDGGYPFSIPNTSVLVQPHFGMLSIMPTGPELYNSYKPDIQFNSVMVLDKEYRYQFNERGNTIRLKYNQNFIRFEFAALSFSNARQNQYAWRLDGLEKEWVYGGNMNKAVYSGLKSGTYRFRVKAANCDGVWGEEKVVKIVIRPPVYATWWFIGLCSFLVTGLIFYWNRVRIRQARRQEKMKAEFRQQISETEMKALRAQMNPHFIFNSLNSIQKYILKNEHLEASQYLTKFSRLIRLILDHSNQDTIPLASELDLLKLYIEMESLRFDNKFVHEIIVAPDMNTDMVELPSMLIQPYVENAIWHGLLHLPEEVKGKLTINISKDAQNSLVVMIDDNGIGREKAAELKSKQVLKKKSYGMQITEDRIAIINRVQHIHAVCVVTDKKDSEGRATGTRVVLTIPIKPLNN